MLTSETAAEAKKKAGRRWSGARRCVARQTADLRLRPCGPDRTEPRFDGDAAAITPAGVFCAGPFQASVTMGSTFLNTGHCHGMYAL